MLSEPCHMQVAEMRTHIGSGLLHLGIKPGATVGLYSVNHAGQMRMLELAHACIAQVAWRSKDLLYALSSAMFAMFCYVLYVYIAQHCSQCV